MELMVTLGLMIIGASVLGLLMQRLGQPLLLGYVIAGILLGPAITGIVHDPAPLLTFVTELGLIFLMFIIGLELDMSKLKDVGKISAMIGTIQVLVVTAISTLAAALLGFGWIQGIYLGLVVSFSSTIVVVKILTESKEIDSLHGELVLGILLIQDLLAVIGLSLLGTLKGSASAPTLIDTALGLLGITVPGSSIAAFAMLLVNFALFAAVTFFFYRFLMPRMFKQALSSAELLFVVSLAVVLVLAALAGMFAFSLAMGAFLAGIALSTAPYSHEVLGRVKPLKDFFLLLFFVSLGMQITFGSMVSHLTVILFILAGAVLLKPVIIFLICKLFKYNNRTSFMVSLHLAQVSEFGLVIIASGITQAVMPAAALTGVIIITIATMVATAYLIKYDEALYQAVKPWIGPMDTLFGTRPEEHRNVPAKYEPELVIIGVNPMTAEAIESTHKHRRILVIDYNPRKILSYKERGIPTICTDAISADLYKTIDFTRTEVVVSAIHSMAGQQFIIRAMREINRHTKPDISIIVSATTEEQARKLYRSGATLVLLPEIMGRRMLSEVLIADDPATLRNVGKVYYEELHKNFVFIREI